MEDLPVISLDDDNNYEQLLKAMGFTNEKEIKEALVIAKNDINEAVSILTSERFPKLQSHEIIMSESVATSPNNRKNNSFDKDQTNEVNRAIIFCKYTQKTNLFKRNLIH